MKALLLGCGKMGGALLKGWLESSLFDHVCVVDHHNPEAVVGSYENVYWCDTLEKVSDNGFDVVILAVKPQQMDAVIDDCKRFASPQVVFISVAIGKNFDYFAHHLGKDVAVVRAMPNLPAGIQRGVTVNCSGTHVTKEQEMLAQKTMEAIGLVECVDDERLISTSAAISGGGPAYVFLLAECLIQSARHDGLSEDMAARMVIETIAGAGEMLRQAMVEGKPDLAQYPEQLRKNVSSPGGSTLQALQVYRETYDLYKITQEAVNQAKKRCLELEADR